MSAKLRRRPGMRRALILLFVVVIAFAPAVALAMSHCPGMMSAACQGLCANFACTSPAAPIIAAPADTDDAIAASVGRVPDTVPGRPDPPPRVFLSLSA